MMKQYKDVKVTPEMDRITCYNILKHKFSKEDDRKKAQSLINLIENQGVSDNNMRDYLSLRACVNAIGKRLNN